MSRPFIELIAAVGPRWELGLDGGMPWGRIKGDLALFQRVTRGKAVPMGRKTWESLPPAHRPLKGRHNMILTRSATWAPDVEASGVHVFAPTDDGHTPLEWAISTARSPIWDMRGVVIIGGAQIYRAALEADLVDVIHLSTIPCCDHVEWWQAAASRMRRGEPEGQMPTWPCDTLFPALDPAGWVRAERVEHEAEDGAAHGWTYTRLVRDPSRAALLAGVSDGVPISWGGVSAHGCAGR